MAAEFVLRMTGPVMGGGRDGRPLPELGISAGVTDLRWAWNETGPAGATIGMRPEGRAPLVGPLPQPLHIPLRAHVQIFSGSAVVYEGYVKRRAWGAGGVVTGVTLAGYAASWLDRWWSRTDLTSDLTSGGVLRTALADLAPWMTPGTTGEAWIDPNVTLGGMDDMRGMTLGAIADLIRQTGDSQGRPVHVLAMPGREVWLLPKVEPSEPRYSIPFDGRVARFEDGDDGMASQVTVTRGTGGSGTIGDAAINTRFLSDWEFAPAVNVQVGNVSEGVALAIRNAELSKRESPWMSATLAASADQRTWLATRHGTPVPPWEPIPTEWVRIAGLPMLPIVATSVDATAGTATYELGERDWTLPKNLWIRSAEVASRYAAMLALNGGKLR